MKTNPLTSRLNRLRRAICPGTSRLVGAKTRLRWLFLLLISLVACKSPAVITNNENHRTRDSNYHATVHHIETHDTIIIGPSKSPLLRYFAAGGDAHDKSVCTTCVPGQRPSKSPKIHPKNQRFFGDPGKGDFGFPPFKGGEGRVLLRISDRTITLHDTVYICRTDTLLRTQTITQKERYIPPFYRLCTISFVSFVTLAFSIHLLLRYLKIRAPT